MMRKFFPALAIMWLALAGSSGPAGAQAAPAAAPLANLRIQVPDGQRTDFLDSLIDFSSEQKFSYRIFPIGGDGKHFNLVIEREDLIITATNPFAPPEDFRVVFYQRVPAGPPAADLVQLVDKVKARARQLQGVVIQE
jgi:hypothetical protein